MVDILTRKVSAKNGTLSIPKPYRNALGINEGDILQKTSVGQTELLVPDGGQFLLVDSLFAGGSILPAARELEPDTIYRYVPEIDNFTKERVRKNGIVFISQVPRLKGKEVTLLPVGQGILLVPPGVDPDFAEILPEAGEAFPWAKKPDVPVPLLAHAYIDWTKRLASDIAKSGSDAARVLPQATTTLGNAVREHVIVTINNRIQNLSS